MNQKTCFLKTWKKFTKNLWKPCISSIIYAELNTFKYKNHPQLKCPNVKHF